MGATQSAPTNVAQSMKVTAEAIKQPLVLQEDMAKTLSTLSNTIDTFKANDAEKIIQDIQKYDSNSKNKNKINLDPAVAKQVADFHAKITSSLGKPNLEMKNSGDNDIAKFFQKDLAILTQNLVANPLFTDNKVAQGELVNVLNSITSTKTKYKYFEYKYLQLNLFIIAFVQQIYDTLNKFTDEVTTFAELRDKYRDELLKNFLKQVVELLQDKNELPLIEQNVSKLVDGLKPKLENNQEEIRKKISGLKTTSLKDLINFIITNNPELKGQVTSVAKSNASTSTNAVIRSNAYTNGRPQESSYYNKGTKNASVNTAGLPREKPGNDYPNYASGGGKKKKTKTNTKTPKKGGFIRDHSTMPQGFYDLQ